MFSSLRIKDFRIYWIALFISFVGTWVQGTAQGWFILELTNSSFYLGLVGFLSTLPTLIFTLPFGVVVDRYNKKKLIIVSQFIFTVLMFTFAVLISTELINIYYILIIATLIGIITPLDWTARQSYVIEIVSRENLLNAIALNATAFNLARIIGPVIAAFISLSFGIASCFYVNGFSYLFAMCALFFVKAKGLPYSNKKENAMQELKEGISYFVQNRTILHLIILIIAQSIFIMPSFVLVPVFVKDIFHSDISGLGFLMSCAGLGAVIGSLSASKLPAGYKNNLVIYLYLLSSIFVIFFSLSKIFLFSAFCLVAIGVCISSAMILINSVIQEMVPDNLRGRIMSIYILSFVGFMPFGNLFAGWLSEIIGAPKTFVIFGVAMFLFSFALLFRKITQKRTN